MQGLRGCYQSKIDPVWASTVHCLPEMGGPRLLAAIPDLMKWEPDLLPAC